MFLQSLLWIPGALITFLVLRFVAVKVVEVWMPRSSREMAEEKLKVEIEKLEDLRVDLEMKKVEANLAEDEFGLEKEMQKNQISINSLKEKLSKIRSQ